MLIIAGLPLMFMELSFGQYAALGPVAVYNKFCPLFRGLGYGMVIVSSVVMLYYNLIIAWTIYYMAVSVVSLFSQLPWQNCDADWSTQCKCLQICFLDMVRLKMVTTDRLADMGSIKSPRRKNISFLVSFSICSIREDLRTRYGHIY